MAASVIESSEEATSPPPLRGNSESSALSPHHHSVNFDRGQGLSIQDVSGTGNR